MPQEIEVWYLVPALRREFARIFVEKHKLSQKKVAEILGVTEAAISQYLKSKRASQVSFSKKDQKKINDSSEEIIKKPENFMRILYNLCIVLRENKVVCDIHKNHDKTIPKNCDVCFQK